MARKIEKENLFTEHVFILLYLYIYIYMFHIYARMRLINLHMCTKTCTVIYVSSNKYESQDSLASTVFYHEHVSVD